jgi:pyruvate/2-oxoglutarate dehydrogenase complex dihydrolipoamide dehydrogenase (E3) component
VLGMHIACPNAGEIIQGFAVAFRKGLNYQVRYVMLCCLVCTVCIVCYVVILYYIVL